MIHQLGRLTTLVIFLLLLLWGICMIVAVCSDSVVRGAPAPLPKRSAPKPPDLSGHWVINVADHRYLINLDRCGVYLAQTEDGEDWWWGEWSIDENRVLSVWSWDPDGWGMGGWHGREFEVRLDHEMRGWMHHSSWVRIKLTRE